MTQYAVGAQEVPITQYAYEQQPVHLTQYAVEDRLLPLPQSAFGARNAPESPVRKCGVNGPDNPKCGRGQLHGLTLQVAAVLTSQSSSGTQIQVNDHCSALADR